MATHAERRRRYALWLDAQQLEFGFAAELALLSDRRTNGVMNDTPPEGLWPAIVPTVRLVERVRAQFGPTTIHSAYRSPAYNAAVTTSTDSRHSHNDAIDFSCLQGTPREWHAFLRVLRRDGAFSGGLGLYKTFVHVDTRGTQADWRA